MEKTVDYFITDDPVIRHLQLVELVLSHCTDVLWSDSHTRHKQTFIWLNKLRHRIKNLEAAKLVNFPRYTGAATTIGSLNESSRATKLPAATDSLDSSNSFRHQKSGFNGLHVASADVILLKNPHIQQEHSSKSHFLPHPFPGELRNGLRPHTEVESKLKDSLKVNLAGSRASRRGSPEPHLDSALSTDSEEEEGERSIEVQKRYRGATPATTPGGEVVMVTPSGHSLHEDDNSLLFFDLPLLIQRLSGGITNELFHVYDPDNPSRSVVVRIFGKETERVISRESELFYQSLFLKTFVHGNNFLIYEYLNSYEPLPYAEMPVEGEAIAEAIAAFQVRATWAARGRQNLPQPLNGLMEIESLSDERKPSVEIGNNAYEKRGIADNSRRSPSIAVKSQEGRTRFERESNYTIHSLTAWVELIVSEEIIRKVNEEKQVEFRRVGKELHEESQYMLKLLKPHLESLGEGVCHNDLLSANFMRHVNTRKLKIIDFDYTKRNFLLFDLANHFNEYTGLECDYAKYFPSDEHISTFVRRYRCVMRAQLERSHADLHITEDIIANERALFFSQSASEEEKAIEQSVGLVKLLTLYSHLSWSIWSLLQEAVSALDVDFLEYGKLRLARYYETKDDFSRPYAISLEVMEEQYAMNDTH
ncbi:unnamed protein product [Phytomonas sp. EM1]|nr:unnamed protein product [Phytomonas sp. EM1]|eukprot:CCW60945.1 unnamed protein product [Phytomonas sp. isolate EM1]